MQGFHLYTSNQLEKLAEQLAGVLERPLQSPLAAEVVVVQSRGMSRWVSLQIARLSGICMNCVFPFPRSFIEESLRLFFPKLENTAIFSKETMAWKIQGILPSLVREREFSLVRHYLDKDEGLKVFQLSEKIAHLFDQYMVYRPDMLMQWERGEGEGDWQAILWRKLAGKKPLLHLAAVNELLDEKIGKTQPDGPLPERISIFGISSLPPLYMRVFFALAARCEVNLFSLDPSAEYHGHDLPPKLKARLIRKSANLGKKIADEDLSTGNPLLTSLGKLNRDFTELRLELDERAGFITREEPGQFAEPHGNNMLAVVQGDILHARNRGGESETPKIKVAAEDRSIQVHSCHSPAREIEVLHDQLLDLFENDPSLSPRDIIVMTPDIEKYAPFISSVFAFPEEQSKYIPFSVADRRPRSKSAIVGTFLSLLELPGSRCTATEIFSLLDRAPIRARFLFSDEDMELIRRWIAGTGIRWGIDAAHREKFGLPELDGNTWRAGLRRLLLGYAMAGNNRTMFEGIMPYDEVEGGDAVVLGRFVTAVESLFEIVLDLPKERKLAEWVEALRELAGHFFVAKTSEEVADLRVVRTALDQLEETAALVDGEGKVGFRAVRHHLAQLLDDTDQRGGFLTGAVTFCALKPMRSIPARVICLIGMDDQAFPRQAGTPAFDLMARERRTGDRSPRDDDRFSFLEAVISARGYLYASHVGKSEIDNGTIPPSVLVSELLDYLGQAFEFPDGRNAREFVTTEHRLHAFSTRYFDGRRRRFFSYSQANAAASRNLNKPGRIEPLLFENPLPEPDADFRDVELRSLIDFVTSPPRYFVRQRLGIQFEEKVDSLEDHEPFDPGKLEQYQVKQELVAAALEKYPASPGEFAARGLLPLGELRDPCYYSLRKEALDFHKKLEQELRDQPPSEPLPVDLRVGNFSLTGKIESIFGNRIVHFRCASLKPKDRLRAWVNHLVRCAALPHAQTETLLFGEDHAVKFSKVDDSSVLIARLLELYWRGLSSPLPFFPLSALAYAEAVVSPTARSKSSPIEKARQKWNGSEHTGTGEKNDAYNAFCFSGRDPIDEKFASFAMEILGPMLRNETSIE